MKVCEHLNDQRQEWTITAEKAKKEVGDPTNHLDRHLKAMNKALVRASQDDYYRQLRRKYRAAQRVSKDEYCLEIQRKIRTYSIIRDYFKYD